MPAPITEDNETQVAPAISSEELLQLVESIDWDAHWREVIEIMSEEATAYEQARARSMEGAARRVFL